MPTRLSDHLNQKVAHEHSGAHQHQSSFATLSLGALGVVYGDIGTSPLYTLKTCFDQTGMAVSLENLMCLISMIFWLLVVVVSIKYVMFILRADNQGEGGNLALLALVLKLTRSRPKLFYFMSLAGIFGGSLFYADAVITPAISVLSAVEGLEVIAAPLAKVVVPITISILLGLFVIQKYGTGKMGTLFGPIMLVWFITLGIFGIKGILLAPQILQAVNPLYALKFMAAKPLLSFIAIGAAMLSVTGAEALYADMGHFGANPIRSVWFTIVWPSLILNYMGQGALLLTNPKAIENPFYLLTPHMLYIPMLVLSAMATVIASQAVISGTYSLTRQAIQLGYLPRMRILHTSIKELGQIYIPFINWALLCLTIFIVMVFPTSDSLASAYGLAVTGAMLITSVMVSIVMWLKWHWSWARIAATAGVFSIIDSVLFSATLTKFFSGGAMPVMLALMIFSALTSWKRGQTLLRSMFSKNSLPIDVFIREVHRNPPIRVPGTAIFMTPYHNVVPDSLLKNLKHNRMLHERVIFLTVNVQEVPTIAEEKRIRIRTLGDDFYQLDVQFGFNDVPDMSDVYNTCLRRGMDFDNIHQTSFYLGRETIVPIASEDMALWRERLFAIMKQNASSAVEYYNIPFDRVVTIGGNYAF